MDLITLIQALAIPREPGSRGLNQVRETIASFINDDINLDFVASHDRFTAKPPDPYDVTEFENLIFTFEPRSKKRRLILAAHIDSKVNPRGQYATDSAVPIAIILTTVKELADRIRRSDVQLQLVLFDGEEAFVQWSETDSLYGSRHLAEAWKDEISTIDLFILLDLIGAPNMTIRNHCFVLGDGDVCHNEYERLMNAHQSALVDQSATQPIFQQRRGGRIEDDHMPFYNRGLRNILHLIATPFPAAWHTEQDTVDNLDFERVELFQKTFSRYVGVIFLHFDRWLKVIWTNTSHVE